jgi:multisubunit Na+/H+ antiporter MnhB subunit
MSRAWQWLLALLLLVLGVCLGGVVLELPDAAMPLPALVERHLPETGVENPVTAVLLNYRGYDTLLELVVLLLALLGAWGLSDTGAEARLRAAPPLLSVLVDILVPALIVVASYLLWVGAYSPGGAFQGGAVLAAAGVIMTLAGRPLQGGRLDRLMEWALLPGIAVFAAVGIVGFYSRGSFLAYPNDLAGTLILLIEAFAMLSIAVTLHTLFAGSARIERAA